MVNHFTGVTFALQTEGMFPRCAAVVFAILMSLTAKGQLLRGKITDSQSMPIPFSTVFVRELSFGTAANEDGYFELTLDRGTYTCVFQSMGYQSVIRVIEVDYQNEPLEIVLQTMTYTLGEVEISDGNEDPAYRIMRKVIRNAPKYAGMVKSYKADVYIRGSLNIRKISAMVKWIARDDLKESNLKEGNTYLEESVNEIEYTAPDKIKQNIKSIHSTFPGNDKNRGAGAIGYISGNIYQPGAFGNARSPLAPGAFRYYRYVYEGFSKYGDILVDKIKVIPRGSGPQFVSGTLYVIEGLWCIYALDIQIDEQLGMTINLKQSYGEVREGAWLPVSNRFIIDADLMGNSGGFTYNTSIKYKTLEMNVPDLKAVKSDMKSGGAAEKNKRVQGRILKLDKKSSELASVENPSTAEAYRSAKINHRKAALMRKDSLRNDHIYVEHYKTVFDSNARRNDSAYWNKIRPIPLAINELKSIVAFDSIDYRKRSNDADSVRIGRGRVAGTLLFGGRIAPDTLQFLQTSGLLTPFGLSFNTVDGFVYKVSFNYQRKVKRNSTLSAFFDPGYAFSREKLTWSARLGYIHEGRYKNALNIHFGSGSQDFNPTGGATPLENSVASLFFRQNLKRYYNRDFIEATHRIDPWATLRIKSLIALSESGELGNKSDFSLFYRESRSFRQNVPDHPQFRFVNHRDYIAEVAVSYKPMPFYVIREGERIPRPGMNETPEFFLAWRKALPLDKDASDFDLIHGGIDHRFRTGLSGNISYSMHAGYFLNRKHLYFDGFKHFSSQPLVTGIKSFYPVIQMGDYYRYSTDRYYLDGHFEFRTPHLLLKKLPLIRSRLWEECLLLNYIYTPQFRNSIEIGYGIGNYFYNIGFFAGFEQGRFRASGLRLSITVLGRNEVVIGTQ